MGANHTQDAIKTDFRLTHHTTGTKEVDMAKGKKRIPTNLKILMGNPGKRKSDIETGEPQPPDDDIVMPEWLELFPDAVKEWNRESGILCAMKVLTVADVGTFAMRCYLASQIKEEAESLRLQVGGKKYTQINALINEYCKIGSLFGLDPAYRSKIKVPELKGKESKFSGLIGGVSK